MLNNLVFSKSFRKTKSGIYEPSAGAKSAGYVRFARRPLWQNRLWRFAGFDIVQLQKKTKTGIYEPNAGAALVLSVYSHHRPLWQNRLWRFAGFCIAELSIKTKTEPLARFFVFTEKEGFELSDSREIK